MRVSIFLASAALGALMAAPANAQNQPPGDAPAADPAQPTRTTPYEAAFFAQFSPRTALDIAQRVPGFSLDLGDSNARGFAGAAGNVVINGARPSSKSDSLQTILQRIPASSVQRVEVGPGDLFGSDYSGKSQVLNVIMSATGGVTGNVTAAARRWFTGYINTDITGSAQIRRRASTINLSAGTGRNRQGEEGTDTITASPSGAPIEYRRKYNTYFNKDPYVSASWALERAQDNAWRANFRWGPSRFDLWQYNRVTSAGGAPHDDSLIQKYRFPAFEVGGDVTRPVAGGAIKFVALATRRSRDNLDTYIARNGLLGNNPAIVGGTEQIQDTSQGETIGRLSWTRAELAGLSVELGAEGVLNTLDSDVQFFTIDAAGARKRVDLPIDQAKVKEKRGEVYVRVGKTFSPSLRVDAGVNYEMSKLTVTGDASEERTLKFLKPSVSVDWSPGDGWRTRLALRRTVAQLNFLDFISIAEISNDRVNGGNAELQPQRTWELRGTVEKPILGDGLVKFDVGHDRISMLQDQILMEGGFSAPGNIGTGRRSFASLTVDAPLVRLGLSGTRLKLFGQVQKSQVHDPISNETRRFSDFFPEWQWNVEMRRDSGAFSYGFTVSDRDRFSFFRANEIDTNWNGGPFGTAFVEYRPGPRTAVTLDIDNAFNTHAYRQRTFFTPNRSAPQPSSIELRERNRHVGVSLTLKQTFGGGATRVAQKD
ncbi:MAG TPA: hypothetical protein VFK50_10950 [Sphingomicrobium sp.]|nr:hypothetical protein [Sphingomicrobium sp.]